MRVLSGSCGKSCGKGAGGFLCNGFAAYKFHGCGRDGGRFGNCPGSGERRLWRVAQGRSGSEGKRKREAGGGRGCPEGQRDAKAGQAAGTLGRFSSGSDVYHNGTQYVGMAGSFLPGA